MVMRSPQSRQRGRSSTRPAAITPKGPKISPSMTPRPVACRSDATNPPSVAQIVPPGPARLGIRSRLGYPSFFLLSAYPSDANREVDVPRILEIGPPPLHFLAYGRHHFAEALTVQTTRLCISCDVTRRPYVVIPSDCSCILGTQEAYLGIEESLQIRLSCPRLIVPSVFAPYPLLDIARPLPPLRRSRMIQVFRHS